MANQTTRKIDYSSPNLYGTPKYTGNVQVKSTGKIIYGDKGQPVGRIETSTSSGGKTTVTTSSSGTTYSGGQVQKEITKTDDKIIIENKQEQTKAEVSKADAQRGFYQGTLDSYVRSTGSSANEDTLKQSGSAIDITGKSGREALTEIRDRTKNLKKDDTLTIINKPTQITTQQQSPQNNYPFYSAPSFIF